MTTMVRTIVPRVLLAVAAVITVASLIVFNSLGALFDGETETVAIREQSEIAIASLTRTVEAEGELIFLDQRPIAALGPGTVTSVVQADARVEASSVLFEIDGEPTLAMIGPVPAWRALTVDDVGADVLQLETNLVALGYDREGELTVDDTFTSSTATVVERWQVDVGLEPNRTVALGSVAFVPDDAQVLTVSASAGQQVQGTEAVRVAGADRVVTLSVAAADLDTIHIGTTVTARLPDRSSIEVTVVELTPTGDGSWTATATLVAESDRQAALPEGAAVPVTVSWTEVLAEDTRTVRANALTRLDNGTYVLEVVADDGSTTFAEVTIGTRSGSIVEIITDLEPGTTIIAP